ncbi:hypothetical protein BC830DRAFT_1156547 [Chytriomyces sp. MP71]|nr:hypothetical protein BC830DRAFT_1156547 [Chytriomyces sp. MP71]
MLHTAEAVRIQNSDLRAALWDAMRNAFANTALGVEPLFHGACASMECVAVVVSTGHCLCPQDSGQE